MIKDIRIKGFRGIKEGTISSLADLTILIGKNGSGKSSILEALYATSSCIDPKNPIGGNTKLDYLVSRRGGRGNWNSAGYVLWYQYDTTSPISIELTIDTYTYKVVIAYRKLSPIGPSLSSTDAVWIFYKGAYINPATRHVLAPNETSYRLLNIMPEELKPFTRTLERTVLIDRRLLLNPPLIESVLWTPIASKRLDKDIVDMIREELEPGAEGLTYIPIGNTYALAIQTPLTTIRVEDLGEGAKEAILISMIMLGIQPTLLLLEEPEAHMHPTGLYTFMKFLVKIAKKIGTQIIATTHSLDMLRIASIISQELKIDTKIIYIERDANGILTHRTITADDFQTLEKLGIDTRLAHVL